MIYSSFAFFEAADDSNRTVQKTRRGKVRGTNIPQEYELAQFVQNLLNPDPTWYSSVPLCEWHGVTCDEDSQVRQIDWSSMRLTGSLQWRHLCHILRRLLLWQNKLTGSVPLDVLPRGIMEMDLSINEFAGNWICYIYHMP